MNIADSYITATSPYITIMNSFPMADGSWRPISSFPKIIAFRPRSHAEINIDVSMDDFPEFINSHK